MRATRANINSDRLNVDFQELYDACLMCSMCYKTPGVIREAYGAQSLVNEDVDRGTEIFCVTVKSKVYVTFICL
jgi:hypothetical protein